VYISTLTDILEEIQMIGEDLCTKYQMTQIKGLVQIPTGMLLKKQSRFYEALNFAATS
jgi:hypothetical protein